MKIQPTLETSGFRTGMRSMFGEVTRICFVTFDIQLRDSHQTNKPSSAEKGASNSPLLKAKL